ncbi:MAG: hypothetical protein OXL36_16795 [Bryobacterales bacterium]|nr:hypothetical protein [Bryobacterales bacterium]MDE0296098.1 hypothetical protein [Bryobacterales bacterium]
MTQKTHSIIAYTADADIYCPGCAREYFKLIHGWKFALALLSAPHDQHGIPETIKDQAGNEAGVVFAISEPADYPEACCACFELIRD